MQHSNPFDQLTVHEIVRSFPASIPVFNTFAIDTCCGGAVPVVEAAARSGANPAKLLEALVAIAAEAK